MWYNSYMKYCKNCNTTKPLEFFNKDSSKNDGYHSTCKKCDCLRTKKWRINNVERDKENHKKYHIKNRKRLIRDSVKRNRKYRKLNPEKYRKFSREQHRRDSMKYRLQRYNITQEFFDSLILKQNNKCAICEKSFTETASKIDHCHKTNKVRGLLCFTCNIHLGFLERGDIKEKMEKYLLKNTD